ncbi:MAG: hypothetical protein UX62_C0020G0010 [Microgenomates group bacterium GW2011_GWA2_46_7]|nr:MAG: hypothetical protein UX62_C0020G0010 [Microgenomates group bacterium GW2011_GWA2_46_7]
MKKTRLFPDQILPLFLTGIVFVGVSILLYIEILFLNRTVITREHIVLHLRWSDILIGLTIYLKTSIDFAIYIGRLMAKFPGWKNRVMIEIGTAVGNALGTLAILALWDVFREIRVLMALMIVIAALVLFRLAEEGLEHVKDEQGKYKVSFWGIEVWFERVLSLVNRVFAPVLSKLIPKLSVSDDHKKGYRTLFFLSFTIPFILGLDDFAGYIPLFNIVNVFGFGVGVFLGHMLLNIFLFLSPSRTIKMVKHPVISFFGSIAFVGLALWGLIEAARLFVR